MHRRFLDRDRMMSVAAVALVHLALLWIALASHPTAPGREDEGLATFDVLPPPSPAPPLPERRIATAPRAAAPAGAAGKAARRTPVAAPSPIILPPPSPIIAATVPDSGSAAVGGAAAIGSGTGAASGGSGSGAGGAGTGTGGGGGTRAQLVSGAIRNRDYPKAERQAKVEGTVTAYFTVGTDGRARDCRVARSSGNAALDAVTCRLITTRFRYRPATDAAGRAVAEERGWQQRWWIAGDDAAASAPGG